MAAVAQRAIGLARHYAFVAVEFGSEVYRRQKMSPPSLDKWPQARQELSQLFGRIRSTPLGNYTPVQVGRGLLLSLEVAGFFVVGEIIGRRQIIGYKH